MDPRAEASDVSFVRRGSSRRIRGRLSSMLRDSNRKRDELAESFIYFKKRGARDP